MKDISELLDLNGRSAIVTGSAKGIGFAIAQRLGQAGVNVLIADIDGAGAKHAQEKLAEEGITAVDLQTDVSKEDEIRRMVDECEKQFGALNILVNNAGIFPSTPISQMTLDLYDKIMSVNLRSVFLATKYGSQLMKKNSDGGRIINVTSIDALHPSMVGLSAYDASKHGVWGLTKNAALEFAPDRIWINAIAPGGIYTPGVQEMQSQNPQSGDIDQSVVVEAFLSKIPMHRMGDPDEIGKVALFLASDMSSYMTGEQIVVDGGALLA